MKLDELLNKTQLNAVEVFADALWKKLEIDIKFTRHFIQRVNDERNGKPINAAELIRLFKKEYEAYGKDIAKLPASHEAVLKDLTTKINLPFILRGQSDTKELVAKTIMRKDGFKTHDQEFPIK